MALRVLDQWPDPEPIMFTGELPLDEDSAAVAALLPALAAEPTTPSFPDTSFTGMDAPTYVPSPGPKVLPRSTAYSGQEGAGNGRRRPTITPSSPPPPPPESPSWTGNGDDEQCGAKRPMNSFMVWAKTERPLLQAANPDVQNAAISKLLGKKWRSMSNRDKKPYQDKARLGREAHKKRFPDYRYGPKLKTIQLKRLQKAFPALIEDPDLDLDAVDWTAIAAKTRPSHHRKRR